MTSTDEKDRSTRVEASTASAKAAEQEYGALRDEIMRWQERRFIVIGATIPLASAVAGIIATKPTACSWATASALLLAFLAASMCLLRQFARFNSVIGSYLEVFHANPWERRMREFRKGSSRYLELNTFIAVLFLLLAGLWTLILFAICTKPPRILEIVTLCVVVLAYAYCNWLLAFRSYPRLASFKLWQQIQADECGETDRE